MKKWTFIDAEAHVENFKQLTTAQKENLIRQLNAKFPPDIYREHVAKLERALHNQDSEKSVLDNAQQHFPVCVDERDVQTAADDLRHYAIVLTAGGEGERLRLSLLEKGISEAELADFTKATYPISGFPDGFGTLQINLCVIASLCRESGIDIPVIITTGPEGSATARVIPEILYRNNNFGLKHTAVLAQEERLHLTHDKKIAFSPSDLKIVTNPDETGGPVMKLKRTMDDRDMSALGWLASLECGKIILLQGTALYDTQMILKIASAGKHQDGLGVGIPRAEFPEDDPFGTLVVVENESGRSIRIIEQAIRNQDTVTLKHPQTGRHLPFNTGFYMFDRELLSVCDLPDYATPPKEVLPHLDRAPKVGYAATDILTLAKSPAILTVTEDAFCAIKNVDDIDKIATLGKRFGLDVICRKVMQQL